MIPRSRRTLRSRLASAAARLAGASCLATFPAAVGAPAPDGAPQLILHHAKVATVDAQSRIAEAVAIRDGRIAAVGTDEEVLRLRDAVTATVDLNGAFVMPGLIDTHVHPVSACLTEFDHEIPVMESIPAVLHYVRERARVVPEGEWIEVRQVFITRLAEQRYPTRAELDGAAPRHPVLFATGPDASLNTLALARSGIDRNFQVADGGTGFAEKDPVTGEPTGILRNCTRYVKIESKRRTPSEAERAERLAALLADYNSVGLTSVIDRDADLEELETYRRLHREGRFTVRVSLSMHVESIGALGPIEAHIRQVATDPLFRERDPWLQIRGVKTYLDGGMLTGSAFMRQPWGVSTIYSIRDPEYRGVRFIPQERLVAMVRTALGAGLQFTAHSVGDGAVHALLDAYEEVSRETPLKPGLACISHSNFMSREAIDQAARLGVQVDIQPAWLWLDAPTLLRQFGNERLRYFQPLHSLFAAGVVAAGGSDHMQKIGALKSVNPYHPFLGMATAVTRRARLGTDRLHPEESLTREEALRFYTMNGARIMGRESELGSLEVGKLADLVVLDTDLLGCPEDKIVGTRVSRTFVGGRQVYPTAR